jgi:hypothetical protein
MDVSLLCLLRVVEVAVSATSWPLVQRSSTARVCVIGCGLETAKNEVVYTKFGQLRHRRNKILRGSGSSIHCCLTALYLIPTNDCFMRADKFSIVTATWHSNSEPQDWPAIRRHNLKSQGPRHPHRCQPVRVRARARVCVRFWNKFIAVHIQFLHDKQCQNFGLTSCIATNKYNTIFPNFHYMMPEMLRT